MTEFIFSYNSLELLFPLILYILRVLTCPIKPKKVIKADLFHNILVNVHGAWHAK